jgi:hypothetical protein
MNTIKHKVDEVITNRVTEQVKEDFEQAKKETDVSNNMKKEDLNLGVIAEEVIDNTQNYIKNNKNHIAKGTETLLDKTIGFLEATKNLAKTYNDKLLEGGDDKQSEGSEIKKALIKSKKTVNVGNFKILNVDTRYTVVDRLLENSVNILGIDRRNLI